MFIGMEWALKRTFLIDAADYERAKDYFWCKSNGGYVFTLMGDETVSLHRWLMDALLSARPTKTIARPEGTCNVVYNI